MKKIQWIAPTVTLLFVLGAIAPVARADTPRAAKPTASSEIGVTPTEVKIAVVADVDTPLAPGLFQSVVDGFNGFAKYINANGGLAGRKVVDDIEQCRDSTGAATSPPISRRSTRAWHNSARRPRTR